MKNYVKPVVLENDEIFEGVYAASGAFDDVPEGENPPAGENVVVDDGDCWTVTVVPEVRADLDGGSGGYKNFRVQAIHPDTVAHISTASKVVITFSSDITAVVWEHGESSCDFDGNTVTITREYHANAYYSGDQYNSLLKVRAETDELTLALTCDATITCTKIPNVQGGF